MDISKVSQALYKQLVENDMSGASVNTLGSKPKRGFMVSIDESFERVFDSVNFLVIVNYLNEIKPFLTKHNNKCVGVWKRNGKFYFDVSTNINNLSLAISSAKMHNQKAIFHLDTQTEIDVK